jgi:hypothetical protein
MEEGTPIYVFENEFQVGRWDTNAAKKAIRKLWKNLPSLACKDFFGRLYKNDEY